MKIKTFENDPPQSLDWQADPKVANYGMTHLINLMGEGVIYVETGVSNGRSIVGILQNCKNIKAAYGIDSYQPYTDEFENLDHGIRVFDSATLQYAYIKAKKRICANQHKDKVKLILEDVSVAKDHFADNSIDFLFLDHYVNKSDVEKCLVEWYNKVKIGGYFAGHDFLYRDVRRSIHEFRGRYNITSTLSVFNAEWVWKKEGNI